MISRPVTFITNPTPYYLIGRTVVVACGMASVYLVYRLGKETFSRAVGLLAALLLAVEPLHVRYSHVAVTDVPATMFGLLALLLFLRAARLRQRSHVCSPAPWRPAWRPAPSTTSACSSCPASSPAGTSIATGRPPHRRRALGARIARRVAAPMALAFLSARRSLCSIRGTSWAISYAQNHVVANGWLGFENVHDGYWYNLSVNLLGSLGMVLLALGLVGIILALVKRTRADYVLVPYVLVYYLYVSSWHELMDRYLLPIVPLLIVLAVRACVALASVPLVRRRGVVVVAAAALLLGAIVLPARASINYSRSLHGTDVRTVAKAWIEHHLPVSAVIAMEPDGPPLVSRLDLPLYSEARLTTSSYQIPAAPAPAGRRRRYARRAVPHRRRGRLCGAELRRR